MRWLCFILILFVGSQMPLKAQEVIDIEKILSDNDILRSEAGYENLVTTLMDLSIHPLNINRADFDSLKMLFLLSDSQIDNILLFRKKWGAFLHLNELLLVPGIGERDFAGIKPFITLGEDNLRVWQETSRSRHEVIGRGKCILPLQEGYKKYSRDDFESESAYRTKQRNRFKGPPVGILLKYRGELENRLRLGLTLENDAGEELFTGNQKRGFDFLSGYAEIMGRKVIQRITLGDYKVQWGQGLVAWGGFSTGKSSTALATEKSGQGITPYGSTDENAFLRGAAVVLQPHRILSVNLFYSSKKTDGTIYDRDSVYDLWGSVYESGLHRNQNEYMKKDNLKEKTIGGRVQINADMYKVGVNILYYDFTPCLIPGTLPYQKYNDSGSSRFLSSIDYKTGYRGIYLFGETAMGENKTWATVNGVRFTAPSASMVVLYRYYDKRYISHYAGAFGEYSNTSNESGIYMGLEFKPYSRLKVSAYYDHFRFFSPRYRATLPAEGMELLCEIVYTGKKGTHTFRYKKEDKPEDAGAEGRYSIKRTKHDYRYQLNWNIGRGIELRSRLNYLRFTKGNIREQGILICQDLVYQSRNESFKTQFRVAYFNTDSYNSRMYCYENNVLYGYSFPMYYDSGWRTYINLAWKLQRKVTFYLKSGMSFYPHRDNIGSSVTGIAGNKSYDITMQVRIKL